MIILIHRSLSDQDEGETTIPRRRSDEMLKDDELTLAVIRNIASLSSNSATGIVIIGGLVSKILLPTRSGGMKRKTTPSMFIVTCVLGVANCWLEADSWLWSIVRIIVRHRETKVDQ